MENDIYRYDLFISYSTADSKIANYVCNKLESIGLRCFIAPRDIKTGNEYAKEIVDGISNSVATLLIYSTNSDKSGYVLREVNSAVARNKTIIPLRIEGFLPSEAMEFYLGPTHWLDAFPSVLDSHIASIKEVLLGIKKSLSKENANKEKPIKYPSIALVEMDDVLSLGYTYEEICMRELELDYLNVPANKYTMNDEIEGTFDDWVDAVKNDGDKTAFLVKDDKIVGYFDVYVVDEESFEELSSGKKIIRDDMIPFYAFGGDFDCYFPLLALDGSFANEKNCLIFLKWALRKIEHLKENGVNINRIGASVYSKLTEKIYKALGFSLRSINPAGGQVYATDYRSLMDNAVAKKIMGE